MQVIAQQLSSFSCQKMTPLSSDRKKSDKTFIDTIWLQLKLIQVAGFLPLQVSRKGFKADKFWEIYYLVFLFGMTTFVIYSHLTFGKEHLRHHNPIILQMTMSQTRTLAVIGFFAGISNFLHRKSILEFLVNSQDISMKLKLINIRVSYSKLKRRIWAEFIMLMAFIFFLSYGVCYAIHPFHGGFLNQMRCTIVSSNI